MVGPRSVAYSGDFSDEAAVDKLVNAQRNAAVWAVGALLGEPFLWTEFARSKGGT